jgi:hypothetical protein
MAEQTILPATELIDHAAVDRAHALANKEALLEHARMGRSVCESRDGQIVTVSPKEIFARYGLNESGKPKSEGREEPPMEHNYITDPDIIAQVEQFAWLDQLRTEGMLNQYRGEYIIAGARQIFAHGPSLFDARREAEPKAAAAGVPPEQLADYFMPG